MKRHNFDIVSFVFGIIFFGLGLTGIFVDEDVSYLEARWIWPTLLVAAGLAIVGFTVRPERATDDGESEGEFYDPVS